MSIDVNYYSFSPSRADKQWPYIKEDLPVLRKRHTNHLEYEKKMQEQQEEIDKIKKAFEYSFKEIQEKIFNHFKKKGYFIRWVEWDQEKGTDEYGNPMWWTDEKKLEYLLDTYGYVYQKGATLGDKNMSYLGLQTDAPELKTEYLEKLKERDDTISNFVKSFFIPPSENKNVVLNNRQIALENDSCLADYLIYSQTFNQSNLLTDLKYLDLYYGGVPNDYFEDAGLESTYLEVLINQFHLKTKDELPLKEEWIGLYSSITPELIKSAESIVAQQLNWNKEEAEGVLIDYLKSIKPVVKDLKETFDAIFVRLYGGVDRTDPPSAEVLLMKRAKQHAKKYKGIALPIL